MRKALATIILTVLWNTAAEAQVGLVLSELLYQPHSGEAEYVELYNRSDTAVDLGAYHIVKRSGDSLGTHYPLPHHIVAAHDYAVLTKNAASVAANYNVRFLSKVVECSLPTYPNDGGSAILATADSVVVDRLDYSPAMHSRLLRNKYGVSLERRSFSLPTNEASNWFSASSLSGYGTPGYENSQSAEYLVAETDFSLSSTLLSPDGDGYQDLLEIEYRLDDGELNANAAVYDVAGRLVASLLNNALLGTHGTIQWDGAATTSGAPVPQGQYILIITVFDLSGTRQTIRRTMTVINSH